MNKLSFVKEKKKKIGKRERQISLSDTNSITYAISCKVLFYETQHHNCSKTDAKFRLTLLHKTSYRYKVIHWA